MMTSNRRFFSLFGTAVMAAALAPSMTSAQAQANAAKNKVVFQMSDGDATKWRLALNNMHNLQVDLGGEPVDLELVAYGPGIGMLKADSVLAQQISEMLKTGAKLVACENTMQGMNLVHADMLVGIDYVPSGVVELVRKQQQGYAYIRP